MKKIIFLLLFLPFVNSASAQTGLTYGVSFNISGNSSNYVGGSSDANALFHTDHYGKGMFSFVSRYFFNEHWSVQSGLGFSSIGFDYALAKDYSLLKKDDHYTTNGLSVSVIEVPLIAIYSFKPNCKNSRWFVGAGASTMNNFTDVEETLHTESNESNVSSTTMTMDQTMTASSFIVITGQLTGGIEKTFKKGGILQFGLLANFGFSNIATSTVNYTIENKDYTHTFNNQGDYFGFKITYFIKPLG